MEDKPTHGGKRSGSGNKKIPEPVLLKLKVPKPLVAEIKKDVQARVRAYMDALKQKP